MKASSIITCISLIVMLLSPSVFASYDYDRQDIQQRIIAEAQRQNLPPSLALAIAKVESDFNPQALSHSGAKGLMQIMPRTAEQVFGVSRKRLFEPDLNIRLGLTFINQLLERYDGRLDIALSHYNGGSAVKNRAGELKVIPATQRYVQKVLSSQQTFLQHDKRPKLNTHFDPSGVLYVNATPDNQEQDSQLTVPDWDIGSDSLVDAQLDNTSPNPQVNSLRALRIHNITRNYKDNRVATSEIPSPGLAKKMVAKPLAKPVTNSLVQPQVLSAQQNAKRLKVRQWESIYTD
jgi:hypothetical protein